MPSNAGHIFLLSDFQSMSGHGEAEKRLAQGSTKCDQRSILDEERSDEARRVRTAPRLF
jgi:hypothetical protein